MSSYHRLNGSQTLINLVNAYARETLAFHRYLSYADIARKENQRVVESVFLETTANERTHGKIFYNYLSEGINNTTIEPAIRVTIALGSIADNLSAASLNEYEEWSVLYPSYGQTAKEEGFDTIAESFFAIASIEKRHDMRFREYLERFNTASLCLSENMAEWECLNCGYPHIGISSPDICPACQHGKGDYKLVCNGNYPH